MSQSDYMIRKKCYTQIVSQPFVSNKKLTWATDRVNIQFVSRIHYYNTVDSLFIMLKSFWFFPETPFSHESLVDLLWLKNFWDNFSPIIFEPIRLYRQFNHLNEIDSPLLFKSKESSFGYQQYWVKVVPSIMGNL